jgi:hypothetical protein
VSDMRFRIGSVCKTLVVGILVLGFGLSDNMLVGGAPAQETKAGPQLCRGHYLSEEAAKEQLARFSQSYSSLDEWKARAKNIREGILRGAELVPMLKKCPLNPIIHSRREYGGPVRWRAVSPRTLSRPQRFRKIP